MLKRSVIGISKGFKAIIILIVALIMIQGCGKGADETVKSEKEDKSAAKVEEAGKPPQTSQNEPVDTLKGIDMSMLSPKQKDNVISILRGFDCPCGCNKGDMVTCRNSDNENCKTSYKFVSLVRDKIMAGVSVEGVTRLAKSELDRIKDRSKKKEEKYSKVYDIDTEGAHFLGTKGAKLKMIVFTDYECPYCTKGHIIFKQLINIFPKDLELVYMHLPLNMHKNAINLASAAEAAGEQGKFFEMSTLLFAKKGPYSDEKMVELAGEIKLDIDKFKKDMKSDKIINKVLAHRDIAHKAGITSTPTVILNKRMIKKKYSVDYFSKYLKRELEEIEKMSVSQ